MPLIRDAEFTVKCDLHEIQQNPLPFLFFLNSNSTCKQNLKSSSIERQLFWYG